jgi:squalene synthase HpnC
LTKHHYENFPVASLFLPRDRRPYIYAVYAFARIADDFADEGSASPAERLANIDDWQTKLDRCFAGEADHPVFVALAETAAKTGTPKQLFVDLLTAFRMDVTTTRFRAFDEVLEYCRFSANPVGRLVLHIFADANQKTLPLSDMICTGLQLANFLQDVAVDWRKGRLYIPLEDLGRFAYTESEINTGAFNERFVSLMRFEVDRARRFLLNGMPLVHEVTHQLRFEMELTVRGGLAILESIEKAGFDVLHARPTLSLWKKAAIVGAAMTKRKA